MTAHPWMPLYAADFLADTSHLTAAETGAYLCLIMHYWMKGGLPTDNRQLARIARMTARQWADSRETLAAFFGEGWTHERVDEERQKADQRSSQARDKALKRHKATPAAAVQVTATVTEEVEVADATSPPFHSDPSAIATGSAERRSARDEIWQDWPARFAKLSGRAESTVRSWIGRVLNAGHPPEEVLEAFRQADLIGSGDPFGYVTGVLRPKPASKQTTNPYTKIALEALETLNGPAVIGPAGGTPIARIAPPADPRRSAVEPDRGRLGEQAPVHRGLRSHG